MRFEECIAKTFGAEIDRPYPMMSFVKHDVHGNMLMLMFGSRSCFTSVRDLLWSMHEGEYVGFSANPAFDSPVGKPNPYRGKSKEEIQLMLELHLGETVEI